MQKITKQAATNAAITKWFDYANHYRSTELKFFDSDTDPMFAGFLVVERNTETINGEPSETNYFIKLQRCTMDGIIEKELGARVAASQLKDFAAFFANIVQRLNA